MSALPLSDQELNDLTDIDDSDDSDEEECPYSQGKIYKIIRLLDGTIVYVGSTRRRLSIRWNNHVGKSKYCTTPIYRLLAEEGVMNFGILLVEDYPCENYTQLRQQEQHLIDFLKPTHNRQRAYRSSEEDRQIRIEYRRRMRAQFKDQLNAQAREEYAKNPEHFREKARRYGEAHREEINAKAIERYHQQAEVALADQLFRCECCEYNFPCEKYLTRHLATAKHQTRQDLADAGQEPEHFCEVCNLVFKDKRCLTRHCQRKTHLTKVAAQA